MGVIYKLRDEVKEFIIGEKKANPHLSCRGLEEHVVERFQIKVSKSSINALIKEAGLSAPVGRRAKKKRARIAMPALPMLLENKLPQPGPESQPEPEPQPEPAVAPPKEEIIPDSHKIEEEQIKKEAELIRLIEEEKTKQEEFIKARSEEERKKQEMEEERIRQEEERERQEAELKAKEEMEAARKKEEAAALRLEREKWERLAREEEERRVKEPKAAELFPEINSSGLALLDAADYLLGASSKISDSIQRSLNLEDNTVIIKIKNLLYSSLLSLEKQNSLERFPGIDIQAEALNVINASFQDVRCAKLLFSDNTTAYLDGQLYSVWSTQHIPYDFSNPLYNLKKLLNRYFYEDSPLVIFNAPGYDIPSPEFIRLLLSLDSSYSNIARIILYGNKLEEIGDFTLPAAKKHSFIFGLWPWQFKEYRKVNKIGEFRQLHIEEVRGDFYIADIDMAIAHPSFKEKVTLRGAVLKPGINEKAKLVILTNMPSELISAEGLALKYLQHWPNPEDAFEDYNRKIELFTYTANSQRFFSHKTILPPTEGPKDLATLLTNYLKAMDSYIKWHFLPSGYEESDFTMIKEKFYDLRAINLEKGEGWQRLIFKIPEGYPCLKDLKYIFKRLNEKGISGIDGTRFYFAIS
ncbi:MAG: hypothetical protein BWY16_00871 [Candidatus Omnitrophica bacterium ADurb.Bin205]|nr:MAG: hypothetical protein BWY16_00871 [Candidatus Omnitrophica bacterium ADurb.Bin205]